MICPYCKSASILVIVPSPSRPCWQCRNCGQWIDTSSLKILQYPLEELRARIDLELAGVDGVDWEVIRNSLLDIINKEAKSKPLTDEELANQLHEIGHEVSIHAVRKYSEIMKIADSGERRVDPHR